MEILVKTSIGEFSALPSFKIAKGQKFTLHPNSDAGFRWLTENDPILNLVVKEGPRQYAVVSADQVGVSTIELRASGVEDTVLTVEVSEFIEATILDGEVTAV